MLQNKMQSGAYKITFESSSTIISVRMGATIKKKKKLSLKDMSVTDYNAFLCKAVEELGHQKLCKNFLS